MVKLRFSGRRSIALAMFLAIGTVIAIGQTPAFADPPEAMPDSYSTPTGVVLQVAAPGVLANDYDPDGDSMTAAMPTMPSHGTVSLSPNGSFKYTPTAGYSGTDSFTYMAHDPTGGMSTGVVTITVGGGGGGTPSLSVNDRSVNEGNAGSTNAVFTITRAGNTAAASSVSVSTMNGTATAGSDYTAVAPTTVNFAADVTTRTVTVPVLGDNVDEANETYSVKLASPTGATISDGTGTGTIVDDDDGPPATGAFSVNNKKVTEPNTGSIDAVFTISRSGSTAASAKVKYVTTGGTATKNVDYTAHPATVVNFAAGEATKTVTVKVLGDTLDETNEKFFVKLSAPTGATIADAKGVGTIVDND